MAERNAHERDKRVKFYEDPAKDIHKYEVDGSSDGILSVTTWIHEHFPHFDGKKVCRGMLMREVWLTNPKYAFALEHAHEYLRNAVDSDKHEGRLFKMYKKDTPDLVDLESSSIRPYLYWRVRHKSWPKTPLFVELYDLILQSWEDNRNRAAELGTAMHANIENYYNGLPHETVSREWQLFKRWEAKHPNWKPYRTEMRVWCRSVMLAGSIDMIFEDMDNPGTYIVVDWKRTEEVEKENPFCHCGDNHSSDNCDAYGNTNLTLDLYNCKYVTYSLQLHTYSNLMENDYDLKVSERYLVVLHPNNPEFEEIKAADMASRVRLMLEERREKVKIERMLRSSKKSVKSPEVMISWFEELNEDQLKSRRFLGVGGGAPSLQYGTEKRCKHANLHVTVHIAATNAEVDFYKELQPILWPANKHLLAIDTKIPHFDRPYRDASSKYVMTLRIFELDDEASRMNKLCEVESDEFWINTRHRPTVLKRRHNTQK